MSTDAVRVDVASPDRWEEVRRVRLQALADTPDAFAATFEAESAQPAAFWRSRLERHDAVTLLASITPSHADRRAVGLAVVAPSWDDPGAAGLYALWAAPSTRGQGVGDALVKAALEHASHMGYTRIVLDVGDDNTHAIRLYERHGFAPTGRTWSLPPPREHITEHERARLLA